MSVRRLLAAGALVSLLLSGCQESKAEPKPKMPEITSTPTETSSPPPKRETPQAFIRRWVAASDEAQTTGDTTEYAAMSVNCAPCHKFIDSVEEVYVTDGYLEFAGTQVRQIHRMVKGHLIFDVTEEVAETVIHRGDDEDVEVMPSGTMTIRVTIERVDGRWTVADYTALR